MAKKVLFDEFHVTVYLKERLCKVQILAARRVLSAAVFKKRLSQAVRRVFHQQRVLQHFIVEISR